MRHRPYLILLLAPRPLQRRRRRQKCGQGARGPLNLGVGEEEEGGWEGGGEACVAFRTFSSGSKDCQQLSTQALCGSALRALPAKWVSRPPGCGERRGEETYPWFCCTAFLCRKKKEPVTVTGERGCRKEEKKKKKEFTRGPKKKKQASSSEIRLRTIGARRLQKFQKR
ncbi:hypothetical protein BC827DRAFT_710272 [Russula dissimulans]|nr:hypothetical protein BC827DRAFT_710272 [Russula dissimulans]